MFFTSYEFLGFMAGLLVLYYMVPRGCQWPLLLVASYVFYFTAGSGFLFYILVTTATVYLTALLIGRNQKKQDLFIREHKQTMGREEKKAYKERERKKRLVMLVSCLLCNIGTLAAVKYTNFFISNMNGILNLLGRDGGFSFVTLAMPLGISFYTLQALGYLIDVYRGAVLPEKNFFRFALFVAFFPQLVQGPISRYEDLAKTLYIQHKLEPRLVCYGLQRVLWGCFKKLVIADRLLKGVGCIISDPAAYHGAYAFVGMLLYTVELYADFTGGIDITIGIAQTMGIVVQENFHLPYISKSLKEYWRRWHISMCMWFRSYVFYPVSVSGPLQRFAKYCRRHLGERAGKRLPVYVSSFVVWFATGIWHGASWNFIVWGLANWLILMVSEELEPVYGRFHRRFGFSRTWAYGMFQVTRTFLLTAVLNLFDCYESVKTTLWMLGSMLAADNWNILWDGGLMQIGLTAVDYGIIAAGTVLLVMAGLLRWRGTVTVREMIGARAYPVRVCVWFGLFLLVLLMGAYGIGYDASQFIYNRF